MTKKTPLGLLTLFLVFVIIFPSISCGGGFSTRPENLPGKLIVNISQAQTDAERQAAIQKVLCSSLSLGFVDANGNQLNPNVSRDSPSLRISDLAMLGTHIADTQGYTINDIVNFLADAGIILSATNAPITVKDILPDIQKYVDWAYYNRDDSKSLLGLLLASGVDVQVVGAAPKFEANTAISTLGSLMLMADILAGVPSNKQLTVLPFENVAYASDTASKVQGLITIIESTSAIAGTQIQFFEWVKYLVDAFTAGSHLSARIMGLFSYIDAGNANPYLKSIEVGANMETPTMLPVVVCGDFRRYYGSYTLNLISLNTGIAAQSGPLYEDVDLVLVNKSVSAVLCKTEQAGHRMSLITPIGNNCGFVIKSINASNSERRIAWLHVTAEFEIPDFEGIIMHNPDKTGAFAPLLDELKLVYTQMKKNIKITPWICQVIIGPKLNRITISPNLIDGGEAYKEYSFTANSENATPPGCRYIWEFYRVIPPQATGTAAINFHDSFFTYFDPAYLPAENRELVQKTETSDNRVTYAFPAEGYYRILLNVWGSDGKKYGTATVPINISPGAKISVDLTIESPPVLETMQTLIFKVKPSVALEMIPQNTAWKWEFGDNSEPVTIVGRTETNLTCRHNYFKNGSFNVKVSLVDKTSGQVLATTTKGIVVDDSASIRKTNLFKIGLRVYGTEEYGLVIGGVYQKQGTQDTHIVGGATFPREYTTLNLQQTYTWKDGGRFEATWKNVGTSSRGTQTTIVTVQGTIAVTPEGIQLYSCIYNYSMSFPNYEGKGVEWKVTERWELKDILITKNAWGEKPEYKFRLEGKGVDRYVVTLTSEEYSPNGSKYIFLTPQWDNLPSGDPPYIEVIFSTTQ